MWQRILVPLDGSALAEQALPVAAALCRALNAEVYLLRVCEDGGAAPDCWLYINQAAESLQRRLGSLGANVHQGVVAGKPAEEIPRYASERHMDVILLSSHGASGEQPGALGKTTSKLLGSTRVPLLVLEGLPAKSLDILKRVLVPLDGSERGEAAIPLLAALAKKTSFSVTLLKVLEEGHTVHATGALDLVPLAQLGLDAEKTNTRRYLYDVGARFYGTKAKVTVDIAAGIPAEEILKHAREMDATLLVLASHMHTAIEKWFYGSISQDIEKTLAGPS